MAAGLVLYDLLYLVLSVSMYGSVLVLGGRVALECVRAVPWPLAVMAAGLLAIVALIAEVALLTALLPRLRPGRYALMKGGVFYSWVLRSLLRRILFLPGLKFVIMSSNILRFLAFRAMGCRSAFTANMSTDADVLDPGLTAIGPGATLGARCLISCHYLEKGQLVLGAVDVGAGVLLSLEVLVAPKVTLGAGTILKARAAVSAGVTVGDGAVIGADVVLDTGCTVGAGAVIGTRGYVAQRATVKPGEKLPALCRVGATLEEAV